MTLATRGARRAAASDGGEGTPARAEAAARRGGRPQGDGGVRVGGFGLVAVAAASCLGGLAASAMAFWALEGEGAAGVRRWLRGGQGWPAGPAGAGGLEEGGWYSRVSGGYVPSSVGLTFRDARTVHAERSEFQNIEIKDHPFMGRILTIDGDIMLTAKDEANYHEMIVHVPMAYQGIEGAENVLVIGGGDGGTVREVLKYETVRNVTLVEIDAKVIEVCRLHFPQVAHRLGDPRVSVQIADGARWVAERQAELKGFYDLVIVDSTDAGRAVSLFTEAFYRQLKALLDEEQGVLVFNLESPSWALPVVQASTGMLGGLFENVEIFQAWIPSFGSGHYAFLFASDQVDPLDYDEYLHLARGRPPPPDLRYYSEDVHRAAFALPQEVDLALRGPPAAAADDGEAAMDAGTMLVGKFQLAATGAARALLASADKVTALLLEVAREAGFEVMAQVSHQFRPWGATAVLVLGESHFSVHTWPEKRLLSVDLYTCGSVDPYNAYQILRGKVQPETEGRLRVFRV